MVVGFDCVINGVVDMCMLVAFLSTYLRVMQHSKHEVRVMLSRVNDYHRASFFVRCRQSRQQPTAVLVVNGQ